MASINNNWESKILSIGVITLTADDEICDGIDNDCDDSSTIRYPEGPEFCESLDNDCDWQVDEGWGQGDDWSDYGEYAYDTYPTDPAQEFSQEQRLAWREGPLAALKVFVPLVQDEQQWGRLIDRFPALDDRKEWHEGSWFQRLVCLMDPPRYVSDRLPMEGRRHYGAWKRWKGAKDPFFANWIRELLEDDYSVKNDECIFDILAQKLQEGFFDL